MANELKSRIFDIDDIPTEVIAIEEWEDIKLEIRGMTGKERAGFLRRTTADGGEVSFEKFFPELVIATVYDPESGEKVFEPADRDHLNKKSGAALGRIADVAQRLSGLGTTDVDDAVGKSEATESNAST